jgi:hypothetical protein
LTQATYAIQQPNKTFFRFLSCNCEAGGIVKARQVCGQIKIEIFQSVIAGMAIQT